MATSAAPLPQSPAADPRVSGWLMTATYVIGGAGYFLGFYRLGSTGAAAAVTPVALLSVGLVGVVSMVRHSLFHRSDAARMGWDAGRRNNFQIEVGFANLGIGSVAIASVLFGWETTTQAAITLVYALYFAQVAVLVVLDRSSGRVEWVRLAVMAVQCAFLGFFAVAALHAVGAGPF